MNRVSTVLAALLAATCACAGQAPELARAPGRVAAPPTLSCDRNKLTSYNGRVTAYQRDAGATSLQVSTDWGTDEKIELHHVDGGNPAAHFRLAGQAFSANDWSRIESEPGVLRDGMRVIAWVCRDGVTPPVIDWRPGEAPAVGY
ncbi:MAG: hypothetical protein GWM87_02290 [Xanthomonadales bacterium]|nr:hypothetical protein [Xanthomonadales bacterium]NIX11894.1 hypothetical protein [Xanthomonadales bacterium]